MSTYNRYHVNDYSYDDYQIMVSGEVTRKLFELLDCLDYDDRKGKLDPLTKHRKNQLKEALRNETD